MNTKVNVNGLDKHYSGDFFVRREKKETGKSKVHTVLLL